MRLLYFWYWTVGVGGCYLSIKYTNSNKFCFSSSSSSNQYYIRIFFCLKLDRRSFPFAVIYVVAVNALVVILNTELFEQIKKWRANVYRRGGEETQRLKVCEREKSVIILVWNPMRSLNKKIYDFVSENSKMQREANGRTAATLTKWHKARAKKKHVNATDKRLLFMSKSLFVSFSFRIENVITCDAILSQSLHLNKI